MAVPLADESGREAPVTASEFAVLMARFAPFEPNPHLAVACSGGADSLALALLAARWAQALGGGVTALTVDHRLRPDSAAEAAQVHAWLAARGIAHETLVRAGDPPSGDVQAAARAARYRLLEAWCEGEAVLHLLTAHQRDDQAETFLLRLARGSGLDGLAGVAALVEHEACRVLRPLLPVPHARLAATLSAEGQDWIEDPSNRDPNFARVRLRAAAPVLAAEGIDAARLAATAAQLGRARAALEANVAALLARAASLHPAGFAWLDPAALAASSEETGLRALAALLATVAGSPYPPRFEGIERLYQDVCRGLAGGRTLGGCEIVPRRGRLLVCREPAAMAPSVAAAPGARTLWDGRFVLDLPASAQHLSLGGLGCATGDWDMKPIPAPARAALPALSDARGIVAIPHVGYVRAGAELAASGLVLQLRPARPLAHHGFVA